MADDFKTSFVDFLKERTTTPLWANFIFIWCVYNWHVLAIIFYSNSGDALSLISKIKAHDFSYWWPIIWAILMTIIIPAVNNVVFWFVENLKVLRNDLRLNIRGRAVKDVEKYYRIASAYNILKAEMDNLKEDKTKWSKLEKELRNKVSEIESENITTSATLIVEKKKFENYLETNDFKMASKTIRDAIISYLANKLGVIIVNSDGVHMIDRYDVHFRQIDNSKFIFTMMALSSNEPIKLVENKSLMLIVLNIIIHNEEFKIRAFNTNDLMVD